MEMSVDSRHLRHSPHSPHSSHSHNRRSVRMPGLTHLPPNTDNEVSSCPNSPAVKKTYRLVVVGSARSGKSSIINRLLEKDEFDDRYIPTIESFHRKVYRLKGEVYQLDILDRSGNDPFPAARKLAYLTGDLFMVVGAVDHAQSIEQMTEYYNQIIECKTGRGSGHTTSASSIPILFVFNKIDLPNHKWQVTVDEVRSMLLKHLPKQSNSDYLMTCSALRNEGVEKAFGRLFIMAKLPKYMNPELHKTLRSELSADGVTTIGGDIGIMKKPVLQRMRSKFSRDCGDEVIIDCNARRPSLRTDLLLNRSKCSMVNQQLDASRSTRPPPPPSIDSSGNGAPSDHNQKMKYGNKEKHCIIS